MLTLQEHLQTLSHHTLRGITTRLKLRHYQQNRKPAWIEAINTGWQNADTRQSWLALLSPQAQAALLRLLQAHQIPAALFWATYGRVRQVTATQQWQPPPWQAPANVSEELYYLGLLCSADSRRIDRTQQVTLPAELRTPLATLLLTHPQPTRRQGFDVSSTRLRLRVRLRVSSAELSAELSPKSAERDKETRLRRELSRTRQGGREILTSDSLTTDPLTSDSLTTDSLTTVPLTSDSLLHDLAQFLIYLHSQPSLRLRQGRWLTRAHLAELNQRLLQPVTANPLPTQRRSPYLRLLGFLAAAAELHSHGTLTPAGWAWLAEPPAAQLAHLWQSWCNATPAQRQPYLLPAATVGPPWPQLLVEQLQSSPVDTPFSATDLVHGLLRANRAPPGFWVAHFHSLPDLDHLVAQTLAEIWQPLGIVAPAPAARDAELVEAPLPIRYQLTPGGVALLQAPSSRRPPADHTVRQAHGGPLQQAHGGPLQQAHGGPLQQAHGGPLQQAHGGPLQQAHGGPLRQAHAEPPDGVALWLDLPAWPLPVNLLAQAQVAAYAHYAQPPNRAPQAYHRYHFTPATLARAAASGHGLPTLLQALALFGLSLTPDQQQQLHTWHAAGRQLTLTHLPLLRTTTPAQLAAILHERSLRPALSEVLSPTTAVITGDLAAFARQLSACGYAAALPAADQPDPATSSRGALATLWLAGRLYAHLGHHLPLPLPPPFAELDRLLTLLPLAQQTLLQAQAAQLHEQLLTLLDHLPFTPPPHPSDPAQWRPAIDQAISAAQLLQVTYFSAGRNLTTRRLLQPYWIEEYRHIPYLRAYCHSAGRVLTFRLDRIMALVVVE